MLMNFGLIVDGHEIELIGELLVGEVIFFILLLMKSFEIDELIS